MLSIFLEEFFWGGALGLHSFIENRGKCCPFFWRNFGGALGLHNFIENRVKMLSIFLEEFLGGSWTAYFY